MQESRRGINLKQLIQAQAVGQLRMLFYQQLITSRIFHQYKCKTVSTGSHGVKLQVFNEHLCKNRRESTKTMHSNDYFPQYLISVFKQLLLLRLHKDSQKLSMISSSFLFLSPGISFRPPLDGSFISLQQNSG